MLDPFSLPKNEIKKGNVIKKYNHDNMYESNVCFDNDIIHL
jgi:hypothetical protein